MDMPMKIALMVRAFIPIPRPSDIIYAPIDLAMAIAKGLGKRGHKVTIFGPIGTEVSGENVTVETMNLRPLVRDQTEFNALLNNRNLVDHDVHGLWDRYLTQEMYKRAEAGEYDLLYFHHPESALSTAREHLSIPTVYTLHDPIYPWYRELFELYASPNQQFVSISQNQRRDAPDLPYLETVYNGTDTDMFKFSEEHDDYLLFTGRIIEEKGVKEAIQVAKESNHRLLIIGPVPLGSEGYFDQYIKPELNDRILYLGKLHQDQLPAYYQKAKALLTPVQWEEPFGQTTVEAMACGTPVISFDRGAAPEIVVDGKTGFIVRSIAEMVEAVGKVDLLKRIDCRNHAANKFNVDIMVDGYESAFRKMLAPKKAKQPVKPQQFIREKVRRVRKSLTEIAAEL